jgi:PKD repeat protein
MSDEKDKKSFWATLPGILTGLAALIAAISGIWNFIPDPQITSFSADPNSITNGSSANLSWSVSNAGSVSIVPGKCGTDKNGYCRVFPNVTTNYTITAERWGKNPVTKSVIVEVLPKKLPGIMVEEPPKAIFNYSPANPRVDEIIDFDASNSKGRIEHYEWDFGDDSSKLGEKVYHEYSRGGIYNVILKVINAKSESSSFNITINIIDNPPQANGTYSPAYPKIGENITFDASQSKGKGGMISEYMWDFGDGFADSGMVVYHPYLEGGTYKVKLTVIDEKGLKNSSFFDIDIGIYLVTEEFLSVHEYLVSSNGQYKAILQGNGNFCIYNKEWKQINCIKERGQDEGEYFAIMQDDGKFCVYQGANPGEQGKGVKCMGKSREKGQYFAVLQDDGKFCIYRGTPEDRGDWVASI